MKIIFIKRFRNEHKITKIELNSLNTVANNSSLFIVYYSNLPLT